MNIDITKYGLQELIKFKDEIESYIYTYEDGFTYICNVRSYGRNWVERPTNSHSVQELCHRYYGEDGIVDVYSTNPNLSIDNYGDVMYIRSVEDYDNWKSHQSLIRTIPELEKEWEKWDNKDNKPFNQTPYFAPIFSKEDILQMKKELEEFDMSFTPPVSYSEMLDGTQTSL